MFLKDEKSHHLRIDIDYFKKYFAGQIKKNRGKIIKSIKDLIEVESIREELFDKVDFGDSYPTDIIIWGKGEPRYPYLTKVGGVPYRPKSQPWPKMNGKDLVFFNQWCFIDSKDIFKINLPGDVLLTFIDIEEDDFEYFYPDSEKLYFEWQNIGIKEIADKSDIKKTNSDIPELFGCLYRSAEYPLNYEKFDDMKEYSNPELIPVRQASRIGGDTYYIQSTLPEEDETLLCTLSSLLFDYENDYGFINQQEKLTRDEAERMELPFGNAGCFYVFMNENGKIRSDWDYHT